MSFSRWRKKPPRNSIVIDAALIRAVIIDNLDFSVPAILYDFVQDANDSLLDLIGEAVANDPEVWGVIAEAVVEYVMSYKFSDIIHDGGLLDD